MSRLSEILGVEEGQEFEYKSRLMGCVKCKIINGMRYTFDGYCWVGCTDEYILTEMINHPERVKILPAKLKLTKRQITAIKGRIAEGWLWVAREYDGSVYCYTKKPNFDQDYYCYCSDDGLISQANISIFNFVKYGECLYLPDLIVGEEE